MKVLLLSRYDRLGASSRLRTMQYLPTLAAEGIEVEIAPFFDADYLRRRYSGLRVEGSIGRAFLRRIRAFRSVGRADLIWLEKEALPWFPWFLERVLFESGVPIVSDYDDAIFHRYDRHSHALVRRWLGKKIDRVMAASELVIAGNAYLAARAKAAGARHIAVVPTVVDTYAYSVASQKRESIPRVGWIGTPATWTAYMEPLQSTFTGIVADHGAVLRAVGAGGAARPNDRLEVLDWVEEREVDLIQSMDIGIMPLDDTAWSRGKCGYKLIQYMACGLPVVASPVGVNADIVEHGVNGFLAETDEDWRTALGTLLRNPALRHRMGLAGRAKVEAEYSLQVYGPRVARLLREATEEGTQRH